MSKEIGIPDEVIVDKIYVIRGQKVMLDRDLAELYGVETKRLKEQVRRNIDRFPESFMFELSEEENIFLRSQFAALKRGRHSKYPPFVFTEHGILMLSNIEEYVDIEAKGKYQTALKNGEDIKAFMEVLNYNSRENGRTPMQWDTTKNAGFTTGSPWKRVNPNYTEINVVTQEEDPNSVLSHFERMTKVRKSNPALIYGDYTLLLPEHEQVYAFTRELENEKMLVLLNFSESDSTIELLELQGLTSENVVIDNYNKITIEDTSITLLPYQAVIFKM